MLPYMLLLAKPQNIFSLTLDTHTSGNPILVLPAGAHDSEASILLAARVEGVRERPPW
jgi:hypothetical protein